MTPFIRRLGHGPDCILAIHCTLAHSGIWIGLSQALEGRAEIVAYDLPSHGRSADWTPEINQHDLATQWGNDVLAEPMHVVGHSYGATVALRLACETPERVKSLTLIEPVFFAALLDDAPDLVAAQTNAEAEYHEAMRRGDHETAARAFNRVWGDGTRWADIPTRTRAYMVDRIHFVPGGRSFVLDDAPGLLSSGAINSLAMPVSLVQGALTLDIIDAVHAALARRIPHAQRFQVENAGHMVPITHPQELAHIVEGMLVSNSLNQCD